MYYFWLIGRAVVSSLHSLSQAPLPLRKNTGKQTTRLPRRQWVSEAARELSRDLACAEDRCRNARTSVPFKISNLVLQKVGRLRLRIWYAGHVASRLLGATLKLYLITLAYMSQNG